MPSPLATVLQVVAVVLGVALVAASLARVQGWGTSAEILAGAVGAVASSLVLFLAWVFRSDGRLRGSFYVDPKRYRGLRIGFVGFCIAAIGWLIGVYFSQAVAYWVVPIGIGVGLLGIIVHFVIVFSPSR
jgi:hypothetical protein